MPRYSASVKGTTFLWDAYPTGIKKHLTAKKLSSSRALPEFGVTTFSDFICALMKDWQAANLSASAAN
jgi:hypothetical protein